MSTQSHSETMSVEEQHMELLDEQLMKEISVFQHGVQTLYLYDGAEMTRLYKRAGTTDSYEEMVSFDGPVMFNGEFRRFEQDESGVITAYHPYAGRMGFYTTKDKPDIPAIKLEPVEKVV